MAIAEAPARTIQDFTSAIKPGWCPGCGDFSILAALKKVMVELQLPSHEVMLVAGIGCSGKIGSYFRSYVFHGLHGRTMPLAMGIKLANERLRVVVAGGDGDGYGIGLGHTLHAMRRNLDLTYIVMNNEVYGLTKGQVSPTSDEGFVTKSTPYGSAEAPINPIALALAAGATFVARAFSSDVKQLTDLIKRGIQHQGFALIDVFSPCVTFNKVNTYEWFQQRVYKLEDEPDYDPTNKVWAFEKAQEGERIPLGLFYGEERKTYEELIPGTNGVPRMALPLQGFDFSSVLEEFV